MGDKQGHPFRGNQYTVGTTVQWSGEALRGARERASNYIRKYGERPEHRAYDQKLAQRGTIVGVAYAKEDSPNIMRKKGDFIGYDVKFEDEQGIHSLMPHMVEPAEDARKGAEKVPSGEKEAKKARAAERAAERAQRIAEFHLERGTLDFSREEAKASKMTDDQLAFARKDAFKAAEAMGRENPKQGFYMDQVSVYAREQQKRAAAPNLDHLARENKIPANASAIEGMDGARYLKRGDADKAVVRIPPLAPRDGGSDTNTQDKAAAKRLYGRS